MAADSNRQIACFDGYQLPECHPLSEGGQLDVLGAFDYKLQGETHENYKMPSKKSLRKGRAIMSIIGLTNRRSKLSGTCFSFPFIFFTLRVPIFF